MPRELPLLTMQWNVIDILGRGHLRHQARPRQAAGNHGGRLGRHDDVRFTDDVRFVDDVRYVCWAQRLRRIGGGILGRVNRSNRLTTAIFQLHVTQHIQRRRLPLQLLRDLAADQFQLRLAA